MSVPEIGLKATIHVGAKVSKAKGRSVSVAVIDGLGEPVRVCQRLSPPDPSPTTAMMRALSVGIGYALVQGATSVECYVPSKSVVGQVAEEAPKGGRKVGDEYQAILGAWVIYWTRDRCTTGWSVEFMPPALMDERVEQSARTAMAAKDEQPSLEAAA